MKPSSSSSATSAALFALAGLLSSAGSLAARDLPPFQVQTLDGRAYASESEPVIKKGYLFLIDERGGFFSLPLEAVDWRATREANRSVPPGLLDRWHEGPVRYLLEHQQRREYRALKSDAERAAWISAFWDALDPTPGSFLNERQLEYWRRVERANFLFADSTRPGWMTDRGRFYILLGPPDEIESFPSRGGNDARFDPRYVSDAPGGYPRHTIPPRGVARWIYRNPPGPLDTNTLIAFREDSSGEYRLSNEGIDYDRVFRDHSASLLSVGDDKHMKTKRRAPGTGQQAARHKAGLDRLGTPAISSLSLLGDLGEIEQQALHGDWLREVVRTREYFGAFPMRSAVHFYRSREGSTYVEINLLIDAIEEPGAPAPIRAPSSTPPFTLRARLVSEADPQQRVEFETAGGFSALPDPEGKPGRWLFQSGAGMAPGTYTLLAAATDADTGQVGSWREIIEVPDLSAPGLLLSDLVLASHVERPTGASEGSLKQPFRHGHLRVLPDVDAAFRGGSELAFYFQVYGAAADPETGRPDLDLEYRIERLQAGQAQALGAPVRLESQRESSHAFSLPLEGWPEGAYRLSVQVTDRVTGGKAGRQAEFRVRAAPDPVGAESP